jgi:orotate phosphoribosyltransferase
VAALLSAPHQSFDCCARAASVQTSPMAHAVAVTDTLARRVHDSCYLTGEFRLRSGQISPEYFDKYLFEGQPALLREVAQAMVALLPECDLLAGMELGGIPLATVMSQLTGLPTVFVRKQAKEYGTAKLAEGAPVDGRRVVVVEDVVTTGGALLASCRHLRSAGATVQTVVCAIDREQGGRENLAAEGLRLRAALTRHDLEATGS